MDANERFKEMAMASKDAIEDFNDFADDRAIAWAYDEITRLQSFLTLSREEGRREGRMQGLNISQGIVKEAMDDERTVWTLDDVWMKIEDAALAAIRSEAKGERK